MQIPDSMIRETIAIPCKAFKSFLRSVSSVYRQPRHVSFYINKLWYNRCNNIPRDEFVGEKWDNLLILDAARPEMVDLADELSDANVSEKTSPGSFSLGFMQKQFFGRNLHDTIYITTNPYAVNIPDNTFYKIIDLLDESWDAELQTVPPEVVVDTAVDVAEQHPHKRLIIHFMQPHFPFLGPTGEKISSGISHESSGKDYRHPWSDQMWSQEYEHKILMAAYRENHHIALENAVELVDSLSGRSVITADHANLIGERGFPIPIRLYGHPQNFAHPNLLRVPWVEFDGEPRDIQAERPVGQMGVDNKVAQQRLRALGYAESAGK